MMIARPRIGVTAGRGGLDEHGSPRRFLKRYLDAVEAAGAEPVILAPADGLTAPDGLLRGLSAVLFTGGPDVDPKYYGQAVDPEAGVEIDAERDELEIPLARLALERDLPVLGICRGFQLLNVVLGGRLIQDLPGHRAGADGRSAFHPLRLDRTSPLARILGPDGEGPVNSRHHQGVGPAELADLAVPVAWAQARLRTGEAIDLVEAFYGRGFRWLYAVQCHPERADEVPAGYRNLFAALVEAARQVG
jgi:putative glutamine amidotransferase